MGVNRAVEGSDIKLFKITSNTECGGGRHYKDIRRLVTDFSYEESVFDASIRATAVVTDAGGDPGGGTILTAMDELKIVGGEKTEITFLDNYGVEYTIEVYVNEILLNNSTRKTQTYILSFCSKELLMNEIKRVRRRFEGKISDHISVILNEDLCCSKALNIDDTVNEYNFLGNNYKPFYWCTSLAKKSVPFKKGKVAGYLFYETEKGYNFKAIDELFKQSKKATFIYNETVKEMPPGVDAKILDYNFDNNIDMQRNLQMGTYNTETFDQNPYDQKYEEVNFTTDEQGSVTKKLGKTKITDYLNNCFLEEPSRYFVYTQDIGANPKGTSLDEQLKNADKPNLEMKDITAQSAIRYQQAFTIKLEITIASYMGLNAGDIVEVQLPEISAGKRTPQSEELNSGLYMISELCHKLTPNRSVSRLVLVRDSYDQ